MNQARFLLCVLVPACAGFLTLHSELLAQNPKPAFHWPDGKRVAVSLSFDDARLSQMDVGLSLFDRSAKTWRRVADAPSGELLGADGNDLVFREAGTNTLRWVPFGQ